MSFRLKTILGIAAIEAVLLIILVMSSLSFLRRSNEDALVEHARATVDIFANNVRDAVITTDLSNILSMTNVIRASAGVVYARVRNKKGLILGESSVRPKTGNEQFAVGGEAELNVSALVRSDQTIFGKVEVGFSTESMQATVAAAQREISVIAVLQIIMSAIFSFGLGTYLTRELGALAKGADAVANGNWGYQLDVHGADELGRTAAAFNKMSVNLKEVVQKLQQTAEGAKKTANLLQRAQIIAQLGNWEFDLKTGVITWSDELYRLAGLSLGQPIGMTDIKILLSEQDRRRLLRICLRAMHQCSAQECDLNMIRKNGEQRIVHVLVDPSLGAKEGIAGLFGIVQDLTERAQAEEQAKIAFLEKRQAEEANRAKTQFLAVMSHELRTPLNAILGYSDLMLEDVERGMLKSLASDITKIKVSGLHLLTLIDEILDLTRVESGHTAISLVTLSVESLVEDICEFVAPRIALSGNRFRVECQPDLGQITTDAAKLKQIIFSLLDNASKFTQNGEITFTVSRRLLSGASIMEIKVIDTGIGFDPQLLQHLFEPFVQADSSYSRKYGGTGMGLAVCKRYCELLHAQIDVHSEKDRGSCITVQIPCEFVSSTALERVATPAESSQLTV